MKKSATKKSISIPSKSKTITFDKFMDKNYGKTGTKKRVLNDKKIEKIEAKLVKENSIKDKVVKPSFDEIALDKDLRKVLKKHDINTACLIAYIPTGKNKAKRIVSTFNPNQEEENSLLDSMMNLLNKINLVSGDIDAICQLVDIAKANEKQVADLNEGKHLSKKEKGIMAKKTVD